MANMSYCRFHNTRNDLSDCIEALDNYEELSKEEAEAGKRMFRKFLDFCKLTAIIEDWDEEQMNDLFDERLEG